MFVTRGARPDVLFSRFFARRAGVECRHCTGPAPPVFGFSNKYKKNISYEGGSPYGEALWIRWKNVKKSGGNLNKKGGEVGVRF